MNNKTKNCIVYASDRPGFSLLEMSAWSVRKYIGDDTDIYVLTDSYYLPSVYNVKCISPIGHLAELGIHPINWSRPYKFESLYALTLPFLEEFKDIDRLVYLDIDVLVKSDKAKDYLFNSNIEDYEIIGSPDARQLQSRTQDLINGEIYPYISRELNKIWNTNNPYNRKYINSGVIIINLKKIRECGLEWYRRRVNMFWNMQVSGKFSLLYRDFINLMMNTSDSLNSSLLDIDNNMSTALITHYSGESKNKKMEKSAVDDGYYKYAAACRYVYSDRQITGRQAILFISHIVNKETLWRYRKIRDDVSKLENMDVIWYLDVTNKNTIELPEDIVFETFTRHDYENSDEYTVLNSMPSCSIYLVMNTYRKHPEYSYIWSIEYDVCYSGDWSIFFREMNILPQDLVCAKVANFIEDVNWMWWKNNKFLSYNRWNSYKCLLCISRYSRSLCEKLSEDYHNNNYDNNLFLESECPTVAINTLSCFDIYTNFCDPSYTFGNIGKSLKNKVSKNKIFHAVKDDIIWEHINDE